MGRHPPELLLVTALVVPFLGLTVLSYQKIVLAWERRGIELSFGRHVSAFIVAGLTVIVVVFAFWFLLYLVSEGMAWIGSRFKK
jgi:hypothetical protein